LGTTLGGGEFSGASYWMLKGILYFDPRSIVGEALNTQRSQPSARPVKEAPGPSLIRLPKGAYDDSRRADSLAAFLQTSDRHWTSESISGRNTPVFADTEDRSAFFSFCGNNDHSSKASMGRDCVTLMRRSDQFVSMSRFTEGSVFDRSGIWKGHGFFNDSPADRAPWLSRGPEGLAVDRASLEAAPYYEGSYLVFYNGNLHNYYHWVVEGLLCLDVLSGTLGQDSKFKIALPKTMDIHALIDHRESLRSFGVNYDTVEIESKLIRVQEAIWVDEGIVEFLPPQYLKKFQQRMSALYAGERKASGRRLLVARRGPTRKIQNLEPVQAFLAEYGFETVYLEGMSMADQITLFQGAEFIIGPHGAGLSNILFCAPGTKVIEFMPAVEMRPFFWIISQKLDLLHGMQFCDLAGDQGFQSSITVDIDKLRTLIHLIEERASS
jgi:Glycosyltransferase 61